MNPSPSSALDKVDLYAKAPGDAADLGARRDLADSSGLLQRVLGIGKGDRAGFGAAVEFIDHRSPPFDHRALDVGRTGGGGVDDMTQR